MQWCVLMVEAPQCCFENCLWTALTGFEKRARDTFFAQSTPDQPRQPRLREHREILPVPASRIKCPGRDLHA